ncbi:ABC transporter ATP-binding protein [Neobacillus kokaensis]|uniref:ABC transporter ATP-binding protein n=1 Tax=Neobacillus kokaensis TaxID=2759023 RepID=A0ABQ3N6P1_9BACI|nr:ABC transporter ATP-binding protein [Neobacillus kokaensis]GHH99168.1 ABC transporter ATP-binding protein [Neobacillus kokaensis]
MPSQILMQNIDMIFSSERKETHVLDNIDLTINKGEIYCLLGPSGCGKSTILKLLAGFESPTRGKVSVNQEIVKSIGPDRAVVFQTPNLFPWLTVYENVVFGLRMKKTSPGELKEKSSRFIEAVGLKGFENHYPHELSGGMQQRAAIARALVNDPTVLLMDEPFAALDAQTRSLMQELVMDVWEQFHTTILFITHDIDEAIFIGDRIGVMSRNPGRITKEYAIELPRPRKIDVITTPEFLTYKSAILKQIQEEVKTSH